MDRLVEAIMDSATIAIGENATITDPTSGATIDIDLDSGGGATVGRRSGGDQAVTIFGNPNIYLQEESGVPLVDTPALILMRELVGHAIPHIIGSDYGNAVDNENKVRAEIGAGQRKAESGHNE